MSTPAVSATAADGRPRWRVLSLKGLVVREAESVASEQLGRLSSGAELQELQLLGDRLRYQKLKGEGPESGWVSVKLKGKDLLCPCDGWRLSPGLAIGPFAAHEEKVTTVLLDEFRERLWTASWSQSSVKCWHLSSTARPLLELKTHGLVADLAVNEEFLMTAISANPMESSACHQADFKQRMAELDDQLTEGQQLVLWRLEDLAAKMHRQLPRHLRGCHRLATWPPAAPVLLASASKERLVMSKCLEDFEVLWSAPLESKLQGLCFVAAAESQAPRLWSFDGRDAKLWEDGTAKVSVKLEVENVSALLPLQELLLVAHETGFLFLNSSTGQMEWQQYTKDVVCAAQALDATCFVAAVGCNVVKYTVAERKATAAGIWTLPSKVLSLSCAVVGQISLVAAGCADGRAAVFDAV